MRNIVGGVVFCAAAAVNFAAVAQDLADYPDAPAKTIILERCGICHTLRNVRSGDYDRQGWHETLLQMRNIGAALSDGDIELLTDYLALNSPANPRPEAVILPGDVEISVREWDVPTAGTMPRDVTIAPDGQIWVSGTFASTLIELDARNGELAEHALRPYSAPFGIAADDTGAIWFASSRRGYIGKFDPPSGLLTAIAMHENMPPDPSDLAMGPDGAVWFTAQNGNVVGMFDPQSGDLRLIAMPHEDSSPFALAIAPGGAVFAGLRDTKTIVRIDPEDFIVTEFALTAPETEARRIAITEDGMVWYADIDRGFLGRLDPETGEVREFASPSGPRSEPHGIASIGNVVWYVEAGAMPNALVRFDPAKEEFQSWALSGYGVIRDLAVTADGDLAFAMGTLNRVGVIDIED